MLQRFDDARVGGGAMDRIEASVVHGVLRREFGFVDSYQSVRRHLTRHYPARPTLAVRHVETPPGMQAQHDWFDIGVRDCGPCALRVQCLRTPETTPVRNVAFFHGRVSTRHVDHSAAM